LALSAHSRSLKSKKESEDDGTPTQEHSE